jgi:hypothetical protein
MVRRGLRRVGVALPYSDVICPEHAKAICIDATWQAEVTVRQKLVFLDVPERGDLHDTCPLDGDTTFESLRVRSPDSGELGRRRVGRRAVAIDWEPRSHVTPYALYEHQYSWNPSGSFEQLALFTEFQFEVRTGMFLFEMITPQAFEAAVVFERPRWTLLNTERRLARYALKQLEGVAERPSILDHGARIEWKIMGPKMGVRYVCVGFHQNGALLWKDRLKKTSIAGGMRQLIARMVAR